MINKLLDILKQVRITTRTSRPWFKTYYNGEIPKSSSTCIYGRPKYCIDSNTPMGPLNPTQNSNHVFLKGRHQLLTNNEEDKQ